MNHIHVKNPVLPGFNPDPSALRVGGDYYIAVSTFEWYPGVIIYHSHDFINWEIAARPLTDTKTLSLYGNPDSCGIWAPHLSFSDGVFYLLVTDVKNKVFFKDNLNYVMTAKDISGEWSTPKLVNCSGFDPSLFHDDDGKKYFLNMLWDYRPEYPAFHGIVMQEFEPHNNALIGQRKIIYEGTPGNVTEGPQIFKKDGYYYLFCAKGGTGYNHSSTVLRAKNIWGPFEKSPYWPLISTRDTPEHPLQKAGHACLIQADEEWYITFLCARPLTERGNCTLGRETGIAKIEWIDRWPRLAGGGNLPPEYVELPAPSGTQTRRFNHGSFTHFDELKLPAYFQTLRGPLDNTMSLTARKGYLRLYGRQSPRSLFNQTMIARRIQSFHYQVTSSLEFSPENFQQMAGLILYYSTENWIYAFITYNEVLQSRVITMLKAERDILCSPAERAYTKIPDGTASVHLRFEVNRDILQFRYSFDGKNFIDFGPVLKADVLSDDYISEKSLVFTGTMAGICAQDMDRQKSYADFDYFEYRELDNEQQ